MSACQKPAWKGQCCCVCAHHIPDHYHCTTEPKPYVPDDVKCVCSIQKGWICMPPGFGRAHSHWTEHGMCEMWEAKK